MSEAEPTAPLRELLAHLRAESIAVEIADLLVLADLLRLDDPWPQERIRTILAGLFLTRRDQYDALDRAIQAWTTGSSWAVAEPSPAAPEPAGDVAPPTMVDSPPPPPPLTDATPIYDEAPPPALPGAEPLAVAPGPDRYWLTPLDSGRAPERLVDPLTDELWRGAGAFHSEEPAPELDIDETIDATVQAGGMTTLVWERARVERGVEVWLDLAGRSILSRLFASELVRALDAYDVPAQMRHFWRVPQALRSDDGANVTPAELVQSRHGCQVLLLTEGDELAERAEAGDPAVVDALDQLSRWPRVALVHTGPLSTRAAVRARLARFALDVTGPEDLGELLVTGGIASERLAPADPGPLWLWAACCALLPLQVPEEDALALRQDLDLPVSPLGLASLGRASVSAEGISFGAEDRATLLRRARTAWPADPTVLSRATAWWRARVVRDDERWSRNRSGLGLHRRALVALLDLHGDDASVDTREAAAVELLRVRSAPAFDSIRREFSALRTRGSGFDGIELPFERGALTDRARTLLEHAGWDHLQGGSAASNVAGSSSAGTSLAGTSSGPPPLLEVQSRRVADQLWLQWHLCVRADGPPDAPPAAYDRWFEPYLVDAVWIEKLTDEAVSRAGDIEVRAEWARRLLPEALLRELGPRLPDWTAFTLRTDLLDVPWELLQIPFEYTGGTTVPASFGRSGLVRMIPGTRPSARLRVPFELSPHEQVPQATEATDDAPAESLAHALVWGQAPGDAEQARLWAERGAGGVVLPLGWATPDPTLREFLATQWQQGRGLGESVGLAWQEFDLAGRPPLIQVYGDPRARVVRDDPDLRLDQHWEPQARWALVVADDLAVTAGLVEWLQSPGPEGGGVEPHRILVLPLDDDAAPRARAWLRAFVHASAGRDPADRLTVVAVGPGGEVAELGTALWVTPSGQPNAVWTIEAWARAVWVSSVVDRVDLITDISRLATPIATPLITPDMPPPVSADRGTFVELRSCLRGRQAPSAPYRGFIPTLLDAVRGAAATPSGAVTVDSAMTFIRAQLADFHPELSVSGPRQPHQLTFSSHPAAQHSEEQAAQAAEPRGFVDPEAAAVVFAVSRYRPHAPAPLRDWFTSHGVPSVVLTSEQQGRAREQEGVWASERPPLLVLFADEALQAEPFVTPLVEQWRGPVVGVALREDWQPIGEVPWAMGDAIQRVRYVDEWDSLARQWWEQVTYRPPPASPAPAPAHNDSWPAHVTSQLMEWMGAVLSRRSVGEAAQMLGVPTDVLEDADKGRYPDALRLLAMAVHTAGPLRAQDALVQVAARIGVIEPELGDPFLDSARVMLGLESAHSTHIVVVRDESGPLTPPKPHSLWCISGTAASRPWELESGIQSERYSGGWQIRGRAGRLAFAAQEDGDRIRVDLPADQDSAGWSPWNTLMQIEVRADELPPPDAQLNLDQNLPRSPLDFLNTSLGAVALVHWFEPDWEKPRYPVEELLRLFHQASAHAYVLVLQIDSEPGPSRVLDMLAERIVDGGMPLGPAIGEINREFPSHERALRFVWGDPYFQLRTLWNATTES